MGQGIGNFIVCTLVQCVNHLDLNEPLTLHYVKASLYDGLKNDNIWNVLDEGFQDPVNTTHQIVNSSFQIVFDVILLLIPLPVIRSLKIRSSAKGMLVFSFVDSEPYESGYQICEADKDASCIVGLIIVYAISFVSLVATAMRLYKVTSFFYTSGPNAGAVKAELSYWTVIELTTAIFCANLPALSSLLKFARGQVATTSARKASYPTPSSAHSKRLRKASDDNDYMLSSSRKGGTRFWPLSVLNSSGGDSTVNSKDAISKATYEDLAEFDFSSHMKGARGDDHGRSAQIHGGGSGGSGDSGDSYGRSLSSEERRRGDKNGTSMTVEQQAPVDGIYRTYEFSAVVEKGLAI